MILRHTILLLSSILVLLSSCSKCNDEIIPFEGFDVAIVDDLTESLVGPDKRYQIEDVTLMVEGIDLNLGHYKKDDIYFFLVAFSSLNTLDVSTEITLSKSYSIPIRFDIYTDYAHCFPHNDLNNLLINGNKYELREQIYVYQ